MKLWTHFRALTALVMLLAAAGLCPTALAQVAAAQRQADRGGLNPDAFYGKESFQGVSVRDSLEAIKKLEDARRMERLRDWNKAADWYQEVIEKYGQYVVPSRTDNDNKLYQYTGIERPVQEQLAKWDPEGLQAYKNRYGAVAASMLASAGRDDRETLAKVMKLYFVTDAGKTAGTRLMDLLLESGDFAEAARIGDRLLDWHPNLQAERARVLFRTALAYHLSGDAAHAEARAKQMESKFADATGTLFGKDVVLSQSLARLLQNAPPVSIQTKPNSIRYNPGGNEERSMVSTARGRPGARMASIELPPPPAAIKIDQNMIKQFEAQQGRVDSSMSLPIMPVVDDDEMFFQDGCRVYAVSLASGVPLPGWMQSYPNSNGQYMVLSLNPSKNQQHTLTLTDNCVLAVMGAAQQRTNPYGGNMPVYGPDQGTRIICLNRSDGKEKWVARPAKIPDENLRQGLEFSGSPLVVGDSVYVIGRGGKNFNEDCYVLCFDLNSGNYKWSCFIASASNGGGYMYGMPVNSDTLSHLAYSSGRVYVLTNLGACAAIDAYAGNISWLNIYPRDNQPVNPEMGWVRPAGYGRTGSVKSWEFNPVIVRDGRVFLLPVDGRQNVLVYDAASGEEIKRIPVAEFKSPEDATGPTALLGVDGKQMFLTGSATIYCIDWISYERGKQNERLTMWRSDFAKEMPDKIRKTDVMGRGFITADSAFVCTEALLYRIDRRTGKVTDQYPGPKRHWDAADGEGPGNLVVTQDRVVVAGNKRVNVYADMVLARKRLDDDVAAAPNDPEPRLRYAEVMFVAGELGVSMEKLNDTVRLLGGLKSMRPGSERDHLFNDCITFATKLQKDARGKGDVDQMLEAANKIYDLASAAADSDSQQVNYRMSRAQLNVDFKQEGSLATAVKLYQEILLNPKLRGVPLIDPEAGGTTQAALQAEKLVEKVKKIDASAYEEFENKAADALTAAGSDPAMLKSVAESYPNSKSAPRAMIAAAEAYEKQGGKGHHQAAHILRQVYNKYAESGDRATMLEGMARNYLAMPDRTADRVDVAAARLGTIVKLNKGDTQLSKPLVLAGNKVLAEAGTPISQALKKLQTFKSQTAAAKLPDFNLPRPLTDAERERLNDEWLKGGADPAKKPNLSVKTPFVAADQHVIVEDVAAIISPPRELRQQNSRHDVIGVWGNGNFTLYRAGAAEALGRTNVFASQPRALAWLEGEQLLVWSDTEIGLLDGKNAQKKWKIDLKSLPRIEVVAGGVEQNVGDKDPNPMLRRRRVFLGGAGLVQGVAQPAVAAPAGPEQIVWVKPVDDRVIAATSAGQVFSVRAADGNLAWQTRLASNAGIDRMVATDDFVVCKVTDSSTTQLVVLDAPEGRLVRRLKFSNDTGSVPVNLALAPDGMLVWVQPDCLCAKDLFEPRDDLNYRVSASSADPNRNPNIAMNIDGTVMNPIYAGATQPDQMLISEGRVLVVSHNGKYVELHSLETGKLLDFQNADGRRAEARLSTVGKSSSAQTPVNDWGVSIRSIGSYLYVTSRFSGPVAYDLEKAGQMWDGYIDRGSWTFQFQDAMVAQSHVVVMGQPQRRGAGAQDTTTFRFHAYSRTPTTSGGESGRLDYMYDIRDEAGITDFEGVDGGLYYLAGDKRLHFMRGARAGK